MKKKLILSLVIISIFVIGIVLFNKKPNEYIMLDEGMIALKVDGATATQFPSGKYFVNVNCNNAKGKYLYDEKNNKWGIALEDITGNVTCSAEFTSNPKTLRKTLEDMEKVVATNTAGIVGLVDEGVNGLRYEGKSPNNWIWFNNEYWRIIGSVPVCETEGCGKVSNYVKLIRQDSIGELTWNPTQVNNPWNTTGLYTILNNYYFGAANGNGAQNSADARICQNYQTTVAGDCDFRLTGIDPDSYYGKMVKEVYWNTASVNVNVVPETLLTQERGEVLYQGKVGLMYVSDYAFSSSLKSNATTRVAANAHSTLVQSQNMWLLNQGYEWTMDRYSTNNANYLSRGNVATANVDTRNGYTIRPVIHLEQDTYVVSGDGTPENPYQIAFDGVTTTQYKDPTLNGADPVYSKGLIPVKIADNGTVTVADTTEKWYDYNNKEWANAVITTAQGFKVGDTIPEASIKAYFVWIPKYSYKLFDLGNYDSVVEGEPTDPSKAQEIQIRFGLTNTKDETSGECTTPMTSGGTGNCEVNDYMTHPAFISMESNGLWVGKFETTGAANALTVKPGVASLRNQNVNTQFTQAWNFARGNDSHMMKNTEWGAVALLSHSKYGINSEVNMNNHSGFLTGYSQVNKATCYAGSTSSACNEFGTAATITQPYNTEVGYRASTTGNITGVYDMAGGAWEYMAALRAGTFGSSGMNQTMLTTTYGEKYFDIYDANSSVNSYQYRILGDATGEMGSFYNYKDNDNANRYHSNWYADISYFVGSSYPWFYRGGEYNSGVLGGQFYFNRSTGAANSHIGFRVVLVK